MNKTKEEIGMWKEIAVTIDVLKRRAGIKKDAI